ncbi:MAG: hypothetical protein E7491_03800, partial [Ruminococcaceae bacterium]|nr:hypothetical protein [Oscillospiraceae bacterium]
MKKVLSIVLALAMLLTLAVGFGGSAEAKNLLKVDEETVDTIYADAWMGGYGDGEGQKPVPSMGSWVNNGEKIEGGWFPSEYMFFDTETVKFGTRSIGMKAGGKDYPHMLAMPIMDAADFEAGKTYTFQAYVKTQKIMSADSGCYIGIELTHKDHSAVQGWTDLMSEIITGTKDWTLLSVTFEMPEVENAYIKFCVKLWGVMAGSCWYDGLAVVEGGATVDYESLPAIEAPKPADPTPAPVAPTLNGEPSAWAKEEILKALEADLVPEHVNSNYTTDITRSDFCDLIIKMIEKKSGKAIADVIAGYADAKGDVSFPDTDSANVIAAAKLGIVNGRSSGAFDPSANITRQEAAKMLALAAKVLGADITASEVAFADADDIYAWAKEFIYYV